MNKIQEVTKEYLMDDLPQFRAGDRITIDYRVIEGGKERIQKFQGDVISKKGGSVEASFTVEKSQEVWESKEYSHFIHL